MIVIVLIVQFYLLYYDYLEGAPSKLTNLFELVRGVMVVMSMTQLSLSFLYIVMHYSTLVRPMLPYCGIVVPACVLYYKYAA